jgi:hypothetical protein
MAQSLTNLFLTYADQDEPLVIELLNIEKKPVGALYFDKLKYKNLVVSKTNNSEKYYLYVDGVGVYFSYYQKISIN